MPQEVESLELGTLQPVSTSRTSSANHGIEDTEQTLPTTTTQPEVQQSQAIIVILQLTAVTFLTSVSTGLMTVSIPRIAADLVSRPQLYYW